MTVMLIFLILDGWLNIGVHRTRTFMIVWVFLFSEYTNDKKEQHNDICWHLTVEALNDRSIDLFILLNQLSVDQKIRRRLKESERVAKLKRGKQTEMLPIDRMITIIIIIVIVKMNSVKERRFIHSDLIGWLLYQWKCGKCRRQKKVALIMLPFWDDILILS